MLINHHCFNTSKDIIVTGVVMRRWNPLKVEIRCDVEIILYAVSDI